jgi:hypothetical protein
MGQLPFALFQQIRGQFIEAIKAQHAGIVRRTE